jgi:histidinol dehydrogenase
MTNLHLRRIDCAQADAARQLADLRGQLSSHAEVISEKGRQLTLKVFGEALPPARVVERVCQDVRQRGLAALLHYTEQFDQVKLDAQTLRVTDTELADAHRRANPDFLQTIRNVRQNILAFQSGLVLSDAVLSLAGKHELKIRYRPVRRVGVCVPGGAAAYPSTLLMTVCPARAAGVREIAVVLPPTAHGAYNPDLLATCRELGVDEVYRAGGAQAVAALAYGVAGLPAVDMIVGPGNLFVTLAKKYVFGQVAIDCLAGPSEVVVVADQSAPAAYVAADLLAQAEHDPATSILITWHAPLLDEVEAALERQLRDLPRAAQARASLEKYGALVRTRNPAEALDLVNQIGPEHLHLATADAAELVDEVQNAGAIFLGNYSPVALGDYAAGPSHVLPTGGTARFASGLSAVDFLRRSSVLHFTPQGLAELADDVRVLAQCEGLTAHAASVDIRQEPAERDSHTAASNGHSNRAARGVDV